jgi:hypothetical protein
MFPEIDRSIDTPTAFLGISMYASIAAGIAPHS